MHPLWDAIDFSIYKPIFHNFNSCIPLGMQRCRRSDYASADQFQFMHPAMDATLKTKNYFTYIGISIHALRVECNEGEPLPEMATVQFQFMHSEWSATAKYSIHFSIYTIFCICYIMSHFLIQSYLYQFPILFHHYWCESLRIFMYT